MAIHVVPPLVLADPSDDPEHYEFLNGQWVKKDVGRKEHSKMGRILFNLLLPFARQLNCALDTEWTIVQGRKKIIPDVTMSFPAPDYSMSDGYLVAPAMLVVETRSPRQRLSKLIDKCLNDHFGMDNRTCWIVDIEQELGYECKAETGQAVVVETLTAGPAIRIPVASVFSAFDQEM
ncbi:MAG: Uma2 family endonuclease [Bryobacteraceae bacterium]